jgi:hypothetical protein
MRGSQSSGGSISARASSCGVNIGAGSVGSRDSRSVGSSCNVGSAGSAGAESGGGLAQLLQSGVLGSSRVGVVTLPTPMGKPFWLQQEDYQLPATAHGGVLVCFEAKADNDIILVLDDDPSAAMATCGRHSALARAPAYEIVIGGWLNTKTVWRV